MSEVTNVIQIPTAAETPAELRPTRLKPTGLKPRLLKVRAEDIPKVLGWRVLVLPVAAPTATDSGIQLAPDSIRHMNLSRRVGVVLAMGPLAFSEKRGFPSGYEGPEVGDWVQFHENSGVDALIRGEEGDMVSIKYIPDADLLAKITNPEAFMVMV